MARSFMSVVAAAILLAALQASLFIGAVSAAGGAASIFTCINGTDGNCGEIAVIGLGDSIASGHGLADDGTACQRSNHAYPYKLAGRIKTELKRDTSVTLLACSGATVLQPDAGTLNQSPDKWLSNQVAEANQQIDSLPEDQTVVVTITVGVDDLDWTSKYPLVFAADDTLLKSTVSAIANQVSGALKPELEGLLARPNVHVVVTSVYDPVNPTSVYFIASGGTCQPTGTVDCYARTIFTLTTLNDALEQTVNAVHDEQGMGNRVSFTSDLFDQFLEHASPSPGCGQTPVANSWIQQPSDPNSLFPPLNGNDCFHPNDAGAQAYADAVLTSLYLSDGFSTGNLASMQQIWSSTDSVVADQSVKRTWVWGPTANTAYVVEPYQHASQPPGTQSDWRVVRYFDKSRMEINDPNGDPTSLWYVTNGLLAKELLSGEMQVGDNAFVSRSPAEVNVAGDTNDPNGPTYATFHALMGYGAFGWVIAQTVDRQGNLNYDEGLTKYGITSTWVGAPTNHWVASVFWDFMNSSGPIEQNGQIMEGKLFQNPFYATGYPLTEAYWTHVLVGGVSKLVLVQVFERRVLTFTPDNPDGWKVEAGNVGLQYYDWRYGG